ncbi:MAG: peptidoglycan editing factor PgeF [Marinicella sp.]
MIETWQKPSCVHALQTTCFLDNESFDIHPQYANPNQLNSLCRQFSLPHAPIFLQQVHQATVIEYKQIPSIDFQFKADACFTRQPGIVCAVMTADCLPVLLTDSAGSFVAAVHCGWRSLFHNILPETLELINPNHDVFVWLGPCIQQPQYEVDESFVNNYLKHHPDAHTAFTPIVAGKSQASLYQMATIQLRKLGIKNISQSNECTFLDDRYYSWRANETHQRMASMLWLKSP